MGLESESNPDIELSEKCDEALYELIQETEADLDFHVDARLEIGIKHRLYQLSS